MNRIVQWFRDDETSTVLKIGVVVLSCLALIGAGFLTGHPILVPLLATLPVALWAGREWIVLNKNEIETLTPADAAAALEIMKGVVGGADEFERLKVLELDRPYQAHIDWLRPEDLSSAVMRGEYFNRPFIAMVVKDAEQEGAKIVLTFFQRYSQGGRTWSHGANGLVNDPFGERIEENDRKIIRQIFLHRNHPRFTLALPENPWFDPTDMLAGNGDPFYAAQQRVRDALGGKHVVERLFNILPIKVFARGEFLEPGDLPTPIVQGLTHKGENFYAVKVRDAELNREVVITFFATAGDNGRGGEWAHNILGVNSPYGDGTAEAEMLRQIVIDKNHPRYTLAEAL